MASQVLSGASNPNYTNNTGQNVRVVINYMAGTIFVPEGLPRRDSFGTILGPGTPAVSSTITLNWAGVSASSSSPLGNIAIGRNLAHSSLSRESVQGDTRFISVTAATNRFGEPLGFSVLGPGNLQQIPISADVSITAVANNASGFGVSLPTELILAPGQIFSAVCSVHNIVVIPELG